MLDAAIQSTGLISDELHRQQVQELLILMRMGVGWLMVLSGMVLGTAVLIVFHKVLR